VTQDGDLEVRLSRCALGRPEQAEDSTQEEIEERAEHEAALSQMKPRESLSGSERVSVPHGFGGSTHRPRRATVRSMDLDAYWYVDVDWRGYVLSESRTELLERHVFVAWVAGFTKFPAATTDSRFAPGHTVNLRKEPDNQFDPNALAVWSDDGAVQSGYVPRVVVEELGAWTGERHGVALAQTLQAGKASNLWIAVAREPIAVREVDIGDRRAYVRTAVQRMKQAFDRSQRWRELHGADPLEQMRQMSADLKRRDST